MKKKETPQDSSALNNFTKEVVYAWDENGNYVPVQSSGWEVKSKALEVAWDEIGERAKSALQQFKQNEASPVLYFMELRIMELNIVADYTGFWQWQVKRHIKPSVFNKLSEKSLQKYANLFEVTIDELKNPVAYAN